MGFKFKIPKVKAPEWHVPEIPDLPKLPEIPDLPKLPDVPKGPSIPKPEIPEVPGIPKFSVPDFKTPDFGNPFKNIPNPLTDYNWSIPNPVNYIKEKNWVWNNKPNFDLGSLVPPLPDFSGLFDGLFGSYSEIPRDDPGPNMPLMLGVIAAIVAVAVLAVAGIVVVKKIKKKKVNG